MLNNADLGGAEGVTGPKKSDENGSGCHPRAGGARWGSGSVPLERGASRDDVIKIEMHVNVMSYSGCS